MLSTAYYKLFLFLFISILLIDPASSQPAKAGASFRFVAGETGDLFGKASGYIENVGQYGDVIPGHPELGKILYGFEGLEMPVLFTTKAIVYLQRKKTEVNKQRLEKTEENGEREDDDSSLYKDRMIIMEWRNANVKPVVEKGSRLPFYHTYGMLKNKANCFKTLIYKDVYPGIDVIYSFIERKQGFEYGLFVHPGADLGAVNMQLSGDTKEININEAGDLLVSSDIDEIKQTMPVSYYCCQDGASVAEKLNVEKINSRFLVSGNVIHFVVPGYDHKRTIFIDPFISPATSLTGMNATIAKDIDYDYDGNVYVSGGGDLSVSQLAKYSNTGSLLWTFSGRLTAPLWNFGPNYGGSVVEKSSGQIYLGQGGSSAFQVIRLDKQGVYDNYITASNSNFLENWKMIWNCGGGTPKIFIAGGGGSDNLNVGICTPPSTILSSLNITGQPGGHQDISDMVIDPKTNELYTIFSQNYVSVITESNRIYKHQANYTPGDKLWSRLSGFTVLTERANRPYLSTGLNDNSVNMLAVNSDYLFYYDGKNLKAMSKVTGADIGSGVTFSSNTVLMQGGIVADECNNIYIGSPNGVIKVYKFTGSIFDDAAAQDITIPGFSTPVYDLVYDDAKRLIYASGKGFVTSIDIGSYCASTIYKINIKPDCSTLSATATISPAVPPGSAVTYVLYSGNLPVLSNTTGFFPNLSSTNTYTLQASIDKDCGGVQVITNFNLSTCSFPPPIPGTLNPGIYVPKAFTPNNDGLNDELKAVPLGMKGFNYFSLYNRWGELVFTTTNYLKGWNGMFKGQPQNPGVYVWIAEAIDQNNKPVRVKGSTLLIR
jgi:gliding motility-associated-like protein